MSCLGFKSAVYHGESCLGELETIPVNDNQDFQFPNNEIRIHHISPLSERCPPLSILQTISSFAVRCKLESTSPVEQSQLINLHASCFHELKTAVVLLGEEELHLVAMPSKEKKFPCFWCYAVPSGLYTASLGMLNLRCLAIVFDLDETLIVANTMKSFEDRIEALSGWIEREADSIRVSGMTAELKRYVDDRGLLKQYVETDCVVDNGKMFKVQLEEVPLLSDSHDRVVRPVIRLPERNTVLTRINPEIRDTSVLVRLRPAWEDLRSYLTAKGRKRFEVYVCTMAERDYALEMWRLLDPEAHLISSKQLLDRVVCVKSGKSYIPRICSYKFGAPRPFDKGGKIPNMIPPVNPYDIFALKFAGARKSLLNVFQDGNCHPKMAMVIDDRLKVWEDKDQARVHVVPAFTPYYAPQAETANAVPVLCVARNVACNVRGCFFKEYDANLLRRIFELFYEDEVSNLPFPPDVGNYLMSEDASFVPNGNTNALIAEGMNGPEVSLRLNQLDEKYGADAATHPTTNIPDPRPDVQHAASVPNVFGPTSFRTVQPSDKPSLLGAPFRRDISSSEFDDVKRVLTVNPSQDLRYQGSGEAPLLSKSVSSIQPLGDWLVEEDINRQYNNRKSGTVHESGVLKTDKHRARQNPPFHGTLGSASARLPSQISEVRGEEQYLDREQQRHDAPSAIPLSEFGVRVNSFSNGREFQTDRERVNFVPSSLSVGALQEIGRRCGSRVEFRSVISTSKNFQFSVEVLFTGEKIGAGMGRTRKDAQQQAAENALRCLADKYVSYVAPCSGAVGMDFDKLAIGVENGFVWDIINPGFDELLVEDKLPKESTSEVAEGALANASSGGNQQVQKRPNPPRFSASIPIKPSKEELMQGSQGVSSSQQPRSEHAVS